MSKSKHNARRPAGGFSLIELLLAVVIMTILAALLTPAILNLLRAGQLNSAANTVANEFQAAQAASISRNMPVEVWFLRQADSGGAVRFRALSTAILQNDGSLMWVTPPTILPESVVMLPLPDYSNILGNQSPSPSPLAPRFTDGVAVRFYPSGLVAFRTSPMSAMTPATPFFVTLAPAQALDTLELPANFSTVQIEPANGRIRILKP